jgi:poly(hydroxyalkanoate) depolymerase family esterase
MNEQMHAGMLDATRLTRAGQLHEATALIQRTLRGLSAPGVGAHDSSRPSDAPIAGSFRVLDSAQVSRQGAADSPYEQKPAPSPRFRAPFRMPLQGFSAPAFRARAVPDPTPDTAPGAQFLTGSYTNAAGTRSYKLYVPSGDLRLPLPLVVMLHGCTQSPDDFAAGTRMNELAEKHQCFVLYPAQAQGANAQKCWNWFNATEQRRDQGEPSLIAGMTREIMRTYAVDDRRVYVAGLSAGGAMAAIMGIAYPDLYAAVGVHSGLPYGAAHDLPSAFVAMDGGGTTPAHSQTGKTNGIYSSPPTIVFHGDGDATVHSRNGDQVIAQSISAHGTKPKVTVQHGHVPDGHAYTRSIYSDASGHALVEHWCVHGAGHAWSGGSPRGSYIDVKGPNASKEMLRFFHEHPGLGATDRS